MGIGQETLEDPTEGINAVTNAKIVVAIETALGRNVLTPKVILALLGRGNPEFTPVIDQWGIDRFLRYMVGEKILDSELFEKGRLKLTPEYERIVMSGGCQRQDPRYSLTDRPKYPGPD